MSLRRRDLGSRSLPSPCLRLGPVAELETVDEFAIESGDSALAQAEVTPGACAVEVGQRRVGQKRPPVSVGQEAGRLSRHGCDVYVVTHSTNRCDAHIILAWHEACVSAGAMRTTTRALLLTLVSSMSAVACGPEASDAEMDDASSGETGEPEEHPDATSDTGTDPEDATGSTDGPQVPDLCPCDQIDAAWQWCSDEDVSAFDALRRVEELVELPEGNTRSFAVLDGTIYMAMHEGSTHSAASLYAWSPSDATFAIVDPLSDDHIVYALTADENGLLLVHRDRSNGSERLSRWIPESGLIEVAEFDPGGPFQPRERGSVRVAGGHAFVSAAAQSVGLEQPWSDNADATFDVDLETGGVVLMPEPVSGLVPTAGGWWARVPNFEMFQYCYDYSCLQADVPTSWELSTNTATPLPPAPSCVEDRFGLTVLDAWVTQDDQYVFLTRASARLIDSTGIERFLWRNGKTTDGLLDADTLWLSTSQDVEDGAPGQSHNELLRVDLQTRQVERWLDSPVDDGRRHIEFIGRLDDQLYIVHPRPDGTSFFASLDVSDPSPP